jgi:hypothetical protein
MEILYTKMTNDSEDALKSTGKQRAANPKT